MAPWDWRSIWKKGIYISTWEIRYDSASFSVRATTGEYATIASVIQTLYIYFSTIIANLSTRFTWVKDLRILCSENHFITENTERVSFIIIAQSLQELISKVHNLPGCRMKVYKPRGGGGGGGGYSDIFIHT